MGTRARTTTTTKAPTTTTIITSPIINNDFDCVGQVLFCDFFSCANDIEVHCFNNGNCGVFCQDGGAPIGIKSFQCVSTGKKKKQGWTNSGFNIDKGEVLSCGMTPNNNSNEQVPEVSEPVTTSAPQSPVVSQESEIPITSFCGVNDLNVFFKNSNLRFNCGKKSCTVECSNGKACSSPKIKCSKGKIKPKKIDGC